MTEDTATSTPDTTATAGALLRQYRETQGFKLDVLAQALRVSPSKLSALEDDRLDDLPDVMFARALSLAVCRQLKVDAAPVLALLPGHDVSRLAAKNERGLDFPLDRPSFLPQSTFGVVTRLFTPLRWAALWVLAVAVVLGFGPDLHGVWVFKNDPTSASTVESVTSPAVPPATTESVTANEQSGLGTMVVTTVHSAAVAAHAASASAVVPASAAGVADVK